MNILKNLNMIFLIVVFAWISLIPLPVQEHYKATMNIFILLVFLDNWTRKGSSIFKIKDMPLWIFIVFASLNVFFAQQRTEAFATYINLALPMAFIYYIASEYFHEESSFLIFAMVVSLFSATVALIGVAEGFFASNPLYKYFIENQYYDKYMTGFVRPISTQFSNAPLASYLLFSLPFNFLLYKHEKDLLKLLGMISMIVSVPVIILTSSQSAFLGLVSVACFYVYSQRKYILIKLILNILLPSVFILSFFLSPYLYSQNLFLGLVIVFCFYLYAGKKYVLVRALLGLFLIFAFISTIFIWPFTSSKVASLSLVLMIIYYLYMENIRLLLNVFLISIFISSLYSYPLNKYSVEYMLVRKHALLVVDSKVKYPYIMAGKIIKDHPVAGIGFQHFRIRFYEYFPSRVRVFYESMIADNMYITLLTESGIVGFSGFLIFILYLLHRARKRIKTLEFSSDKRLFLLTALASLIGLLVNMSGYELFYWPSPYLYFCILTGCIKAFSE